MSLQKDCVIKLYRSNNIVIGLKCIDSRIGTLIYDLQAHVIFQSGIPLRQPIRRTIMVKSLRGVELRREV